MRKRRRTRQVEQAYAASDKRGAWQSNSISSDGLDYGAVTTGFRYEKSSPRETTWHSYGGLSGSNSGSNVPASDDPEDATRDMERATFGSVLVPKQHLRVTNPEDMEGDGVEDY